jgi:hypothetical protein
MSIGRRIGRTLSVALLAAAALAPATAAGADCLTDFGNSLLNIANTVDSPECGTAFSEAPEVTTALAAGLGTDVILEKSDDQLSMDCQYGSRHCNDPAKFGIRPGANNRHAN